MSVRVVPWKQVKVEWSDVCMSISCPHCGHPELFVDTQDVYTCIKCEHRYRLVVELVEEYEKPDIYEPAGEEWYRGKPWDED